MNNTVNLITPTTAKHKPRPVIDLLVSIVIPSIILMKFSDAVNLGATTALIVALAFPLGWGLLEFFKHRKLNFNALLGLISDILTATLIASALDDATTLKTVQAWQKLLWIQNDFVSRHYR